MIVVIQATVANIAFAMYHLKNKARYPMNFVVVLLTLSSALIITGVFYALETMEVSTSFYLLAPFITLIYIFLYLALFNSDTREVINIYTFAGIYTFSFIIISVETAELIKSIDFYLAILIVHTIMYLFAAIFAKKVNRHFKALLLSEENTTIHNMMWLLVSLFGVTICLNVIFSRVGTSVSHVILMFIWIAAVTLSINILNHLKNANIQQRQLLSLMRYDTLTNTLNRDALFDDLQELVERKESFAIFAIDLDDFKSVNDDFGHETGDTYLVNFVKQLKEIIGVDSQLYRRSGDEFIITTNIKNAPYLLTRLRNIKKLDNINTEFLGASIGVAKYPEDSENVKELLHIADLDMYENKKRIK